MTSWNCTTQLVLAVTMKRKWKECLLTNREGNKLNTFFPRLSHLNHIPTVKLRPMPLSALLVNKHTEKKGHDCCPRSSEGTSTLLLKNAWNGGDVGILSKYLYISPKEVEQGISNLVRNQVLLQKGTGFHCVEVWHREAAFRKSASCLVPKTLFHQHRWCKRFQSFL